MEPGGVEASRAERATGAGRFPATGFAPFREVEVLEAIRGLALKKAPGPDGRPAEVYENMPSLLPALTGLVTRMVGLGRIPGRLLEVHIAPLDKPRKDSRRFASKRPTPFVSVLMKMAEAAIPNRIIRTM